MSQVKALTVYCILVVFRTAVRSKSDGHHASYKPLTMDDMPVPKGSWQEHHGKANTKYNLVLIGGFGSLAASIYIVSVTCH